MHPIQDNFLDNLPIDREAHGLISPVFENQLTVIHTFCQVIGQQ